MQYINFYIFIVCSFIFLSSIADVDNNEEFNQYNSKYTKESFSEVFIELKGKENNNALITVIYFL